jgi:hypothetical protein
VKLYRPAAAAIGVAVVAASALAVVAPASAATDVTFVTASDFGTVGPSSSAPGTWNETDGTMLTDGISGISLVSPLGSSDIVYTLPAPIAITGSALVDAANATSVHTSSNTNTRPEIYWRDAGGVVRRFLANAFGNTFSDPSTQWTSSISINGSSSGTLSAFAADFAADPTFDGSEIIAFNIYINAVGSVSLHTVTMNGTDFSFMPVPVVTGAAAQITRDAFVSTGYPVTASGFVPGETISVYSGSATAGTLIDTATVDVNGVVSYTWIAPSSTPQGAANRTLTLVGDDSAVSQFFTFAVSASVAAPGVDASLAATGVDASVALIGGGVLLLGGVALSIVAAQRRRTV